MSERDSKDAFAIQPIRQVAVTEEVMKQIEDLILNGSLRGGEKLPSEPELSERLGVSRATVREALRALSAVGLVRRDRRGTYVNVEGQQHLLQRLTYYSIARKARIADLAETRMMLEVGMAGLAAERALEEDIAQIERTYQLMEESVDRQDRFVHNDANFHLAVAQAAHNTILAPMLGIVRDLLVDYIRNVLTNEPAARQRALDFHRRILEAIRNGDVEAAQEFMRAHLEDAFSVALEEETDGD